MLLTIFLRTVFFFIFLLIALRIMGKREISHLSPFDFVVSIMIAESAVLAIENPEKPLLAGIIPVVTLVIGQILLAVLTMKNQKLRRLASGSPSIVISNGKIDQKELKRLRYNIDDLLAQLRQVNIINIHEVEFAILETSGKLSIIPKSQFRALRPKDLGIETQYEGLPATLIEDGKLDIHLLKRQNLDMAWLTNELGKQGVKDYHQIFLATLDTQGNLYVEKKEQN